MDIKIGLSTSNAWVSRIIRRLTSSPVSHAFLFVTIDGKTFIAEAAWSGFRLILSRNWVKSNEIILLKDPPVSLDKGWEAAEDWLGEGYDYPGLFGYLWVLAGRRIRRKWYNPFHSSKSLFCSESVVKVMQASGWPGSENLDPSSTSPADLYAFLKGGNL